MAGWKPARGCCEAIRVAVRNEKQLFNEEAKWQ